MATSTMFAFDGNLIILAFSLRQRRSTCWIDIHEAAAYGLALLLLQAGQPNVAVLKSVILLFDAAASRFAFPL